MSIELTLGQQAVHYLIVVDPAQNPINTLVDGDFDKYLLDPTETEVSGSVVVTVIKVATPGKYKVTFTPTSLGVWKLSLFNDTYATDGWHEEWKVVQVSSEGANNILISVAGTVDSSIDGFRFIDAVRSEGVNFWRNRLVLFNSGDNTNQMRRVKSFNATTKEFEFFESFSNAILPGNEYVILGTSLIDDVTGADEDNSPVGEV